MRTLRAASWWLLFGQPPPLKTIENQPPPLKTITSNISKREPPPPSKAARNPNSADSEVGISDAEKTETLKVINSPSFRIGGFETRHSE